MTLHKRVSPVHSRKFARSPAGIHVLFPRFSPTAIYPGMGTDDLPSATPSSSPVVAPPTSQQPPPKPPVTSATPNPVTPVAPSPSSPVAAPPTTTSALVPTPATTQDQPLLSTSLVSPTEATPALVLTTATTSSLNMQQLPTTTLNGQPSLTSLPNLATRSIAPAIVSGSTISVASESATSTPSPSSTNTGAIVGGIAAGLAGIAVIVVAFFFLVRRWRKRTEDNAFSADGFRRSAVLLDDPPTHEDTVNRGYNPRPPSMIERKVANSTPAPYANFGGQQAGYGATGYNSYDSYGPGDVMSSAPQGHYPYNNTAQYNAVSPYAQSPFSPATPASSHPTPYDSPYPQAAGVAATAAMSTGPINVGGQVARQQSLAAPSNAHPGHASINTVNSVPPTDYVDLTRSSVSPYQAAQYVEISKQLNTEVPAGLSTPDVNQYTGVGAPAQAYNNQESSPFADTQRHSAQLPSPYDEGSPSADLDFPTPPAPVAAAQLHARVDSHPPLLPEIRVQPRVSGYDEFPAGNQNKLPATPSPLAASFAVATPPVTKSELAGPSAAEVVPAAHQSAGPLATSQVPGAPHRAPATSADVPKRPDTVYDDGDAYGGF